MKNAEPLLYNSEKIWEQSLQLGQKNLIQALIDFFPNTIQTVLDVGCGDGKITQSLVNALKFEATGIDFSQEALSRCPFKSLQGNATSLPFQTHQFDVVMTTDMLEHLSNNDEEKAWKELFRVAKEWVIVAVPFREELLDATARCVHCHELYHVNWHLRSYDWQDLTRRAPDTFEVDKIVLTGEPWPPYSLIETTYRRHFLNEWSGWEESFCPHCQEQGSKPEPIQPLSTQLSLALGNYIYADLKESWPHREHSEILVFYRRKEIFSAPPTDALSVVEAVEWDTNKVCFESAVLYENLVPYPQVARIVQTEQGIVAQFPNYSMCDSISIQSRSCGKKDFHMLIEDERGPLYNDRINLNEVKSYILKFPRKTCHSYYGTIVRIPFNTAIYSIQFGKGLSVMQVHPHHNKISYSTLNFSEHNGYLQIVKPFYFNPLGLVNPPYFESDKTQILKSLSIIHDKRHMLMLCHDQHIDRRIIAQANSLIQIGFTVTLIALSHNNDCSEESLSEGFKVVRIGLRKIIPENLIYRLYIKSQNILNYLLNFSSNYLPFGNKIGSILYKMGSRANWVAYQGLLLLRYQNRKIKDPLPFKAAFFNAALSLPISPNIIQVHDLPALEAGVELAKKWKLPLVYDAHELYPEQRSFSRVQRKICSKRENKSIQFCQMVFAVNDSIAHEMSTRYAINTPTALLNAIDPPAEFNPSQPYNLIREKLNLSCSEKILLFQGGFSPHRNLENLILAMCHVKNTSVNLVLMGFGDYEFHLKKLAKHYDLLCNKVHFLPAVSQSDLLMYSASADIGIIPYPHVDLNSYYCTPNKLFEFIQAGVPILANDSPELRRFVQEEGFGLVQPMKSPKQIAQAIDYIFNDPQYDYWKRRLRERKTLFSWTNQSETYLQAIRNTLDVWYSRSC